MEIQTNIPISYIEMFERDFNYLLVCCSIENIVAHHVLWVVARVIWGGKEPFLGVSAVVVEPANYSNHTDIDNLWELTMLSTTKH